MSEPRPPLPGAHESFAGRKTFYASGSALEELRSVKKDTPTRSDVFQRGSAACGYEGIGTHVGDSK